MTTKLGMLGMLGISRREKKNGSKTDPKSKKIVYFGITWYLVSTPVPDLSTSNRSRSGLFSRSAFTDKITLVGIRYFSSFTKIY